MSRNKTLKRISVFILISFIFVGIVKASSTATMSLSGPSSVNPGESFSENVYISNISGVNVNGVGATSITSDDSTCVAVSSVAKISGLDGTTGVNGTQIAYMNFDDSTANKTDSFSVAKVNLTAGSNACSTTIHVNDPTIDFFDGSETVKTAVTKVITVVTASSTKSSDATLSSLTPSTGTLSPTFSSGTTTYTMSVDNGTDAINFGTKTSNGSASVSGTTCNLSVGTNSCNILVTAEDGTKKTYTVNVTRASAETTTDPTNKPGETKTTSSDASLKYLNASGYTMYPSFNSATTTYTIYVGSNISGLKVTAEPSDSNANVAITGNSGWQDGTNTVQITVTATDGTKKIYTINAIRKSNDAAENAKSTNNYLKSLITHDGTLAPEFNRDTDSYNITVPNDVNSLNLNAVPEDDKATVTITGNESFVTDKINTVTITVKAEDGSERNYTINVTKSTEEGNTKLDKLIVSGYKLSPEFASDVYEYNVDIPYNVDHINLSTVAQDSKATVDVMGNENLKDGDNTVLVKVTDEKGFTRYYEINVHKDAEPTFLGLARSTWFRILGITLGVLAFLFLLFLILKKKKEKKEEPVQPTIPSIEIKPEFNFGSKNGTDDDIIEPGGVNNQYSGNRTGLTHDSENDNRPAAIEARVVDSGHVDETESVSELPYDPYDDIVTKDELYDAIQKAKKTNDATMLNMLLAQEKLNRAKEKMKKERSNDDEESNN